MDKAEITQKLEAAFYPHECGVKFLPTNATYWERIGIRVFDEVTDEDEGLPPFEPIEAGRDAVEHDLDQVIADWKEDAGKAGFRF